MTVPPNLLPKPGDPLDAVPTPQPVIDEDRLSANIQRAQGYMDAVGLYFRPHIKTHKIPAVATAQIAAGACGINCQKITEAEVFADAGFEDILITYNILGADKLARLAALHARIGGLKVVADSTMTVDGLATCATVEKPLEVLVECDTGAGRCGVQTPEEAFALARHIHATPGLAFGGLLTYPKPGAADDTEAFLACSLALLDAEGIPCPIRSNAGTPGLFDAHRVPSATEYRAGTYVYNDRSMVRAGHCEAEDCAMHVLATVVSRPAPDRAVIDAGSKALSSDLLGMPDYGTLEAYPGSVIRALSEEHGVVDLSGCTGVRPDIGTRVRVVPNHTCVISNLFDVMVFHRDGVVTRVEDVAARGRVW